jgi:hypothetical protein
MEPTCGWKIDNMSGLAFAFIVLGVFSRQTRIFHSAQDKHKKYNTTTG